MNKWDEYCSECGGELAVHERVFRVCRTCTDLKADEYEEMEQRAIAEYYGSEEPQTLKERIEVDRAKAQRG